MVSSITGSQGKSLLIATTAAVGGLLFGYDTSVISGAILFLRKDFQLTSVETEWAVSIVLAGALLGAGVGGYLGDRLGRKRILILTAVLFGVFALATGMASGLVLFMIARFVVGLAVGITSMITPLYIAEIAPSRIRGGLVTLNQLAIATGIALAYGVGYFYADAGNWRAMFISAVIPSLILLIALIFLPESPRWLASQGRFDEARLILHRVQEADEAERNMKEIIDVVQVDRLRFVELFKPRFRKAIVLGVGLAVFQQITGVNTIIYYTPTVLQMAGFDKAADAILTTVIIGVVNIFFTAASILLLDRVGRRPLLLLSVGGMGLSLTHLGAQFGSAQASSFSIVVGVLVYLASFSVGLGPVFWLLISEIYPMTIRGQAMSLAAVTIWAFDWLVTVTFLSLIDYIGARGSFSLYALACAVALLFCFKMVPETKGRTLEQIEASW